MPDPVPSIRELTFLILGVFLGAFLLLAGALWSAEARS